jgi:hypothetical protein
MLLMQGCCPTWSSSGKPRHSHGGWDLDWVLLQSVAELACSVTQELLGASLTKALGWSLRGWQSLGQVNSRSASQLHVVLVRARLRMTARTPLSLWPQDALLACCALHTPCCALTTLLRPAPGGVIVPMDATYPARRLEVMVRQTGATVVIASRNEMAVVANKLEGVAMRVDSDGEMTVAAGAYGCALFEYESALATALRGVGDTGDGADTGGVNDPMPFPRYARACSLKVHAFTLVHLMTQCHCWKCVERLPFVSRPLQVIVSCLTALLAHDAAAAAAAATGGVRRATWCLRLAARALPRGS